MWSISGSFQTPAKGKHRLFSRSARCWRPNIRTTRATLMVMDSLDNEEMKANNGRSLANSLSAISHAYRSFDKGVNDVANTASECHAARSHAAHRAGRLVARARSALREGRDPAGSRHRRQHEGFAGGSPPRLARQQRGNRPHAGSTRPGALSGQSRSEPGPPAHRRPAPLYPEELSHPL